VKLFVDFASRHKGSEHIDLAHNHRCRPQIVQFARAVVDALPAGERLPKMLESSRELAEKGAVEVLVARDPDAEAKQIADRIEALMRDGHDPGEIAVLYRSVRTSACPLVQALQDRKYPPPSSARHRSSPARRWRSSPGSSSFGREAPGIQIQSSSPKRSLASLSSARSDLSRASARRRRRRRSANSSDWAIGFARKGPETASSS
jgi:hypothetical protein